MPYTYVFFIFTCYERLFVIDRVETVPPKKKCLCFFAFIFHNHILCFLAIDKIAIFGRLWLPFYARLMTNYLFSLDRATRIKIDRRSVAAVDYGGNPNLRAASIR